MDSEVDSCPNEDNKIRARTVFPGSNKVIEEYSDGRKVIHYNKPDPDIKSNKPSEAVRTAEGFITRKGGVQSKEFAEVLKRTSSELKSGGIQAKEFVSTMEKRQQTKEQGKTEKDANE